MSTGNNSMFGEWCAYDPNVFCQERMECKFCCKMLTAKSAMPSMQTDMVARKVLQTA